MTGFSFLHSRGFVTSQGIEVMHLFQGRPLCTLHLSPFHSSHQDINGDGVIERVSAVHNPGECEACTIY